MWHQLPLLAPYWQTEQLWKSHQEWLVPGPAKVFVAFVLTACCWKFASLGILWGIFGPGYGRVLALQRTMLLGHPSVHTTCRLGVRTEISHCWKAKILEWFLFTPCFDFMRQGLLFFQTWEQKVQQCKKHAAFFHSFIPKQFRGIFFFFSSVHSRGIWPNFLVNKMLD